jgi:ketosteroid isomerase-like protein
MIRRLSAVLLLCLLASSAFAADAVEEVRNTELAFAKAFADRDAATFFSYVADDATFLAARVNLVGKAEIVKRWSPFFNEKVAPFTWRPERVFVTAGGNIGLSTGPVFDKDGLQAGIYSSVWQKNANGEWKIIFDGPGAPSTVDEGFLQTPDGTKLHYRKTGRGAPAIIIPLDQPLWDSFSTLADHGTVIAYDPRGRGRSTPVDRIGFDYDLRDLESVRRHFNIDRVIPVGYSYFGLVAAMYARDHPEHIERLVQISPVAMSGGVEKVSMSAKELKPVSMPVLIVRGAADGATTETANRTWAKSFPLARLLTIEAATQPTFWDLALNAIRSFVGGGWPDGAEIIR